MVWGNGAPDSVRAGRSCQTAFSLGENDMALFDALIDDLAGHFGLGANAGPLVREVLSTVTGSPGGLVDKLKTAGFGSDVESWLGHADASPVPVQLMDRLMGSTPLGGIAGRLG